MHEFFSDIESYNGALLPGVRLPNITIDQKYYKDLDIDVNVDNFTFLKTLCERSLVKKDLNRDDYKKRLEMELSVLNELGFIDYVLLNWDFINFCHVSNILVGSGRGSAASSLVLFLIGVTDIDPIKFQLIFERFVNKARSKIIEKDGEKWLSGKLLCDVDNDIEMNRRPEVIKYIENKNPGKTCKILTINTLSSKLCIKEVGKMIGGLSEQDVNNISSLIPKTFGKVASFDEAIKQSEQFKNWAKSNERLINVAKKIAGLQKNTGVHPSGIAVSFFNVEDVFPIRKTKDGDLISGYDMGWVSEFAVKFDILGLRTLSVVEDICKSINISLSNINPEDPLVYKSLEDLRSPHGLFQIEAGSTYDACKKIKPKNLEHLSGVVAISRPGAMAFIDQYADYTNNGVYKSIHTFFDEFLSKTGGICLYQEDLLKMIHKVGFDLTECEEARRCIGKKDVEAMNKWESKIKDKVKERKLDPSIGDILWKIANDSAKYQFNKCLALDTIVESNVGDKMLFDVKVGDKIKALDIESNIDHFVTVLDVIKSEAELYEIELEDGRLIKTSLDHKFLSKGYKMITLREIIEKDLYLVTD